MIRCTRAIVDNIIMARTVYSVAVFLHCLFLFARCQNDVMLSKFSKDHGDKICDVSERVDRECSVKIPKARSRVHCVSMCGRDKSCIGVSMDQNGQCFHHKECPILSGSCTTGDNDHEYVTKYCAHGSLEAEDQSCKCVDGFFGNRCKQCHRGCVDLIDAGYSTGLHMVYIDPDHNGQKPFLVACAIGASSANIQLLRNNGVNDFNKTWVEYVNGFYYDDDNLWLGLYALHRITNAGLDDLVFLFRFLSHDPIPLVYRTYHNLRVSSEADGHYRLTIGSSAAGKRDNPPEGTFFGDCLTYLHNTPFSTWDADRDQRMDENCASSLGSGWWYKECYNKCNVFGYSLQFWDEKPRNQIFSLPEVDMNAIRPGLGNFLIYVPCPTN